MILPSISVSVPVPMLWERTCYIFSCLKLISVRLLWSSFSKFFHQITTRGAWTWHVYIVHVNETNSFIYFVLANAFTRCVSRYRFFLSNHSGVLNVPFLSQQLVVWKVLSSPYCSSWAWLLHQVRLFLQKLRTHIGSCLPTRTTFSSGEQFVRWASELFASLTVDMGQL